MSTFLCSIHHHTRRSISTSPIMLNIMQQFRLLSLLLRPSLLSFTICLLFAVMVLLFSNLPYLSQSVLVRDYISIDAAQFSTILQTWQMQAQVLASFIFDRSEVYVLFVSMIAIVVGVLVFASLELFSRSTHELKESLELIHFAQGEDKVEVEKEVGLRWLVRISAAIGWLIYWGFWLSTLLLFCVLLVRIGLAELPSAQGISYIVTGSVLLALGAHMHIVFLRLILLRPRVFGIN